MNRSIVFFLLAGLAATLAALIGYSSPKKKDEEFRRALTQTRRLWLRRTTSR